jgi:chromosome partitioning protein
MIVISSVNQKGGTGKTTTIYHLSYLLARKYRVLTIDLDPQATLTIAYGVDPDQLDQGVDTVLETYATRKKSRLKLTDVALDIEWDETKFKLVPSRDYLEGLNVTLTNVLGRERILSKAINDIDGFDIVLIDCQPTFSLLTINAMVASDYLLIPVETAYFSLHGLLLLLDTIEMVREELNPNLKILGIIPFKYDKRLTASRKNLERIKKFEDRVKVYPSIPLSTFFEKSIEEKKPLYAFTSKTAKGGLKVFEEIVRDIERLIGR